MNPKAEELTRWPQAEVRGAALENVFHIVNEETRQPAINPVSRVLREGTVRDYAYLLESGSVVVFKGDEIQLAALNAPTVFGEMALLNPEGVRTASVRATTELRALTFPIVAGLSLLRRYPAFKARLLELSSGRSAPAQHATAAGGSPN